MVEIRNIRFINGIIYADCYPEKKESQRFSLEIDTNTREITYLTKDDYDCYVNYAKKKLLKIFDSGEPFPEITGEMWV